MDNENIRRIPEEGSDILFIENGHTCFGRYAGNDIIYVPDFDAKDTDRTFSCLSRIDKWMYLKDVEIK